MLILRLFSVIAAFPFGDAMSRGAYVKFSERFAPPYITKSSDVSGANHSEKFTDTPLPDISEMK
jgi:hypothetical protein